jgi:hypothetical protein
LGKKDLYDLRSAGKNQCDIFLYIGGKEEKKVLKFCFGIFRRRSNSLFLKSRENNSSKFGTFFIYVDFAKFSLYLSLQSLFSCSEKNQSAFFVKKTKFPKELLLNVF